MPLFDINVIDVLRQIHRFSRGEDAIDKNIIKEKYNDKIK